MTNYNKKKNKEALMGFYDICHGNLFIPLIRLLSGQFCGCLTWQLSLGPSLLYIYTVYETSRKACINTKITHSL